MPLRRACLVPQLAPAGGVRFGAPYASASRRHENCDPLSSARSGDPKMANVLIADDNVETVQLCCQLLKSAGHRVQTGTNGEEGLKSLKSGPLPDCVLLDVDMPLLSGPGMAHQMLLHDAGEEGIPILLVSGRGDLQKIAERMGTP